MNSNRIEKKDRFPIIGIGASDGGATPFDAIIDGLPINLNAAVVFMLRLSADNKGSVRKILPVKVSSRPIIEIVDAMPVENGKIYVNPSGHDVTVKAGRFNLRRSPKKKAHFPIDIFFTSIAEEAQDAAVAVILSGAGTDGVRGIREIQCKGGSVLVQDPATAEYGTMPQSAIEAGNIDEVLAPEDIAERIVSLINAIFKQEGSIGISEQGALNALFNILHEKTGYGFEHYKRNVIARRVQRRMSLHGFFKIDEYRGLLDKDPSEFGRLASDLMIGVTGFFRDPGAWESLKRNVIAKLITDKKTSESIRVWTPGCSTGEEAYSIAMMLLREIESAGKKSDVQVFATDINEKSLTFAREGKFPSSVTADIPAEYLKTYFTCTEDGMHLRINKYVRDHVVFAKQNLLTDPPFSKLDLLICRNLLIYLEPESQDKSISIFHYTLKENGHLFLGNAESVGRRKELFKSIGDKNSRLYQRTTQTKPVQYAFPAAIAAKLTTSADVNNPAANSAGNMAEFAHETLLSLYAPAAVEADRAAIRQLERELSTTRDELQTNVEELRSANEELQSSNEEMQASNEEMQASNEEMQASNEELETSREELQSLNEELVTVNTQLQVKIEEQEATNDDLNNFLSSSKIPTLFLDRAFNVRRFTPAMIGLIKLIPSDVGRPIGDMSISRLGADLLSDAQTALDKLSPVSREVAIDKAWYVRSALPYMTSDNRIEGVVITFVDITGRKKDEEKLAYQSHLLANVHDAAIGLDADFIINYWNESAKSMYGWTTEEAIGRKSFDLLKTVYIGSSREEVASRIQSAGRTQYDAIHRTKDNNELFVEVRSALVPGIDGKPAGFISICRDQTERKRMEEEIKSLAKFPSENPNPIMRLTSNGVILYANEASEPLLQMWNCEVGRTVPEGVLHLTVEATAGWLPKNIEIECNKRIYSFNVVPIVGANYVNLYGRDITERKNAEHILRESQRQNEFLASVIDFSSQPFAVGYPDGHLGLFNNAFEQLTGYSGDELRSIDWSTALTPPEWREIEQKKLEDLHKTGLPVRYEKEYIRKDGTRVPIELLVHLVKDTDDKPFYYYSFITDITERRKAQKTLRESEERFHGAMDNMLEGCQIIGMDWRFIYINDAAERHNRRPSGDLIGNRYMDVWPGIESTHVFEVIRRCLEERTAENLENEFTFPDGTIGWFDLRIQPVPEGVFILSVDITERKNTEEALVQARVDAEQRMTELKVVLDVANVAIWIAHDPQCLRITGNRFADEVIMQVSREANISASARPGDAAVTFKVLRDGIELKPEELPAQVAAATGKQVADEVLELRFPDGRSVYLFEGAVPLFDAEGRVRGAVAVAMDITEQRKAEEQMKRYVEELRASNEELERFNHIAVDRELRMIELKKEINALRKQTGQAPLYPLDFEKETQ
jgi:PAS domain S-box-containing protein